MMIAILASSACYAQTNKGYSKKKTQATTTKGSKSSSHNSKSKPSGRSHSSAPSNYKPKPSGSSYASAESNVMSQQERDRIIQNLISNMVYVEGGTFTMGATSEQGGDAESDEKPIHYVTISSFSIGKYEVTQTEWQAVMGSNPSYFTGDLQRPVERVSWNDCQEFIRKLNVMTGKHFRLPTEAEWEYAARGGNSSRGNKYAGSNTINDVAWYWNNSDKTTHPVGTKSANELDLYDMSGNVWEWCQDRYGYYSGNLQYNPTGPSTGSFYHVYRGGDWNCDARSCRVANRYNDWGGHSNDVGFRLAL